MRGADFKENRVALGLTQEAFAITLGVTPTHVRHMEHGRRKVTPRMERDVLRLVGEAEEADKESTCGNCKSLRFGDMGGLRTAYCGHDADDDFIVPHTSRLENGHRGDKSIVTLTRIPTFCPRDASEVRKSEKPAPAKEWVTLTV